MIQSEWSYRIFCEKARAPCEITGAGISAKKIRLRYRSLIGLTIPISDRWPTAVVIDRKKSTTE
jgi:hypothetical protein